jgi:NAD(P)H-flavin reductase
MALAVNNLEFYPSEKRAYSCECTSFAFIAGDTVSLEFFWPGPVPKSGQFFLIKPSRTGIFLGRPISVAGYRQRKQGGQGKPGVSSQSASQGKSAGKRLGLDLRHKADRRLVIDRRIKFNRRINIDRRMTSGGYLRFLVTRRGQGSRDIVNIRPGEEAELIGPLGSFWPLDDIPADNYRGKRSGPVALVSGGIGIAPLLTIIPELGIKTYDFYAGFKTTPFGLENINPRALIIATEDGSEGVKGRILDFFTPKGYCRVFACGPEPMLKTVSTACIAGGVPCYISVEKHMACGVGACKGCTVKTTKGNKHCCTDGPVFNAEEICFEAKAAESYT